MSKVSPEIEKLKKWVSDNEASVSFAALESGVQATVRNGESVVSAEGKDATEASKRVLDLAQQVIG